MGYNLPVADAMVAKMRVILVIAGAHKSKKWKHLKMTVTRFELARETHHGFVVDCSISLNVTP